MQLKWHHQFQFAGYYAAKELGYYSALGLDVELRPVSNGQNPVENVLNGGAEYGVGASDLVLLRAKGKPVVALGTIFQHSPYILLALHKNGVQTIADLAGRKVMVDPYAAEIVAYLKYLGLYPDKIKPMSSNDYYPSDLVDGKVDAYAGYITNDPYYLEQRHIPYLVFTPQSEGIDFYGDTLFTLQKEIDDHPARVSAFLSASLKGWNYAINHPEVTVDLMIARGYVKASERDKLLFEAKGTQKLVASNLVSIGYMNPARWQYIADIYAGLGMVSKRMSLKGFLYSDEKPKDNRLLWILGTLSCLGFIATLFSTHLYSLNRRLKLNYQVNRAKNLSKLRRQAKDLRNLYYIDELTGLPNLKMFKGWVNSLLKKSERAGIYALLYLDFDNFKVVNNTYSHKIGDAILQEMVSRIQSQLRETSHLAHIGVDKFIILVTGLGDDRDQAVYRLNKFTNKLIQAIRDPYDINNVKNYLTVSIGAMLCPPICRRR